MFLTFKPSSQHVYISTYYKVEPSALLNNFLHAELVGSRDAVAEDEDEDELDIVTNIKEHREKPQVAIREVRSQGQLYESNEDTWNYNDYNQLFVYLWSISRNQPSASLIGLPSQNLTALTNSSLVEVK